ncbi:two-component system histidine kinase PnpS [Fervidibacillus halotolerans]|uniref:histidine kinase n=1 Tax=Fervidibacillus halotolerans TaxID=2980027 RepID=A0A9E8RXY7_9BACI|nr:ATP-binding protein [Fervidibacillus halotolerans]WAA11658.1 ATP-binding protein [Fervidibacillus halotolerans]
MKKFRFQLFFALISLIIVVFMALGFLLGQLFENYFVRTIQEHTTKETDLIVNQLEKEGSLFPFNDEQMEIVKETLNGEFFIITNEGNPIFQSTKGLYEKTGEQMISKILKNVHHQDSGLYQGTENGQFYYWRVIEFGNQPSAILIMERMIDELNTVTKQIWMILFFSLGSAFFMILYIGSRITSIYIKPVESATKAAIELAKGNYQIRTYEDYGEFNLLNSSINILARNLQKFKREQEMQTDRLMTIIEHMGSGLILIDDKGYIRLTNRTYNETFHVDGDQINGRLYSDFIEHEEIKNIIEEVFMTEQTIRKQVIIPIQIYMKHFEIYGAPIISYHNEWKGIVLVFHDITELKKLEQIRKDFVANVSHELKTPITSIKGFTETLLDGAKNDCDALETFLSIIYKESERLQSLINDLLELSKIEQEGFTLQIERMNINQAIEETVRMLESSAEEKQIQILYPKQQETLIEGDFLRIKQILINLISNGITYTPKGGTVQITIDQRKEYTQLSVKDTGIGIDPKEIPRIFERFYRVDKARSRNSGGTGLGLAIVKHLVEAHSGEIQVESELGKGSTFIVKLPNRYKGENGKGLSRGLQP